VLFRNALLLGASSVILAHNHPSGLLEPSAEDIAMTAAIAQGGALLDIEVLDHLIYTAHGYTSIRQVAPQVFETDSQYSETRSFFTE